MRHPEQILESSRALVESPNDAKRRRVTPMGATRRCRCHRSKPYESRLRPHLSIAEKRTSGHSGWKPLTELEKSQRENLLSATVMLKESLWKNRCRNDAED